MRDVARFWDDNAGALTFTHPLDPDWFADLPKTARILDYGCGYGRTVAQLADLGWKKTCGVDFSAGMIARGHRERPDLDLRHVEALPLNASDGAFDAAILFAVLTTIPDEVEQRDLMSELRRLIRPGGLLYLSDYPLQTEARNVARYETGFARHGVYGVWDRDDGGVFRHHGREALDALTRGFDVIAEAEIATTTLSGAAVTAVQRLCRRV